MELRFGRFPEHHHFLLIARPFVEWCFKFVSWLFIVSTIRYAYERTEDPYLLGLWLFTSTLLLGFVGALTDWTLKFELERSERKSASNRIRRLFAKIPKRAKSLAAYVVFIGATIVMIGSMNAITERVIDAIVGYQRSSSL